VGCAAAIFARKKVTFLPIKSKQLFSSKTNAGYCRINNAMRIFFLLKTKNKYGKIWDNIVGKIFIFWHFARMFGTC
jgi:hypothetical protein